MSVLMPKRKARDCMLVCELALRTQRQEGYKHQTSQGYSAGSYLSRAKRPKQKGKDGQRKQRAAELV